MKYGDKPKSLGLLRLDVSEMLFYQDMLIKEPGQTPDTIETKLEARLDPFKPLIGMACCDFIAGFGLRAFKDHRIYITAKHLYQPADMSINRPGWHTDGFGTADITYIWSNAIPTEFCSTEFNITEDDKLSMIEMEDQAKVADVFTARVNEVIRLNRYNVHRPNTSGHATMRAFAKVIFSLDKFQLTGNSINPFMSYDGWEFQKRQNLRNVPQSSIEPAEEA